MASKPKKRRNDQGRTHQGTPRNGGSHFFRGSSPDARMDKAATPLQCSAISKEKAHGLEDAKKSVQSPKINAGGMYLKIQQAKKNAVAQAQQEGCTGNFRSFDSPFGNFLVPVIPTLADLTACCNSATSDDVLVLEALATKFSLDLALDLGIADIMVESDSRDLVLALNGSPIPISALSIIDDI